MTGVLNGEVVTVPAGPKPGDVLSGEAAKAYMLANPGRRVRCDWHSSTHYEAVKGVIYQMKTESGHVVGDGDDTVFSRGGYSRSNYVVLPPEPAKPATPDLDLAGRVSRVEKAVRHTLDALKHHEFTEPVDEVSIDMALKALEGGGSDG